METIFDDIRPYNKLEMTEGMKRIAEHRNLKYISAFIRPGKSVNDMQDDLLNVKTVEDFQHKIMYQSVGRIIDTTTSGLSYSGFDKLDIRKPYLFISNHRDIVLDPAFLQWVLISEGLPTSYISFGDNLLISQLYKDLALSNKMFKVIRGGSMKEVLKNSQHLSDYIRFLVSNKNSVWLAQRNGRTKDGLDTTDQGLLKMLSLSADKKKTAVESFAELNIMPMAISYENEPCDILKAREVYCKLQNNGVYIKKEGEDNISIMTGIQQQKGKVHIALGNQITFEDIDKCRDMHVNILNHKLAEMVDREIRSSYHLMQTNYIAHDVLHNKSTYSAFYSDDKKKQFVDRVNVIVENEKNVDRKIFRNIFLGIYANPIDAQLEALER